MIPSFPYHYVFFGHRELFDQRVGRTLIEALQEVCYAY